MSARKERDPIFALIEAHARAVKAQDKANLSLARLQARIDATPSEKRKGEHRRLTCVLPYVDLGGSPVNPGFAVRSHEEIARRVWGAIDNAAFVLGRKGRNLVHAQEKAAVAELQRRYDAALRAHNAHRRAVGLIAREKAAETAESATMDALIALMKAAPSTPEGQKALARHLSALSPAQAPWWVMQQALKNAAA